MRFDLDLPAWKWPFYVARHPFEGFEDVRWKKAYHSKVALLIVLAFFLVTVAGQLYTGFLHKTNFDKVFNIVPLFSSSVIIFFVWVVGNWSLCTLFDGEGTMKEIMCVSAYALVPYIYFVYRNSVERGADDFGDKNRSPVHNAENIACNHLYICCNAYHYSDSGIADLPVPAGSHFRLYHLYRVNV